MRLFWPTVDMLLAAPVWTPPAGVALRPAWFRSLGAPPAGDTRITFDTGRLRVSDGRFGVLYRQDPWAPEIAVFRFSGGALAGEFVVRGPRPAALLFDGDARISASIDARAAGARAGGPGLGGHPGGGGGFAGRGGETTLARGGASYGLKEVFEVGSGGQSGASTGGLGGGGLQLGATGALELRGARLCVDGFAARPARAGTAGGGGSGGAIVLHGGRVRLDRATRLSVRGGAGGEGLAGAHGGGGGAGGFVLGVTVEPGIFDPGGAFLACEGGPCGRAAGPGERGAPGERGVAFLAGKRLPTPGPVRERVSRLARSLAWASEA